MTGFPTDIFTEPDADVETLRNLGPLTAMAGVWKGVTGEDVHPVAPGELREGFIERRSTVLLTLAIPRGEIAMAVCKAQPDAKSFRLEAVRGSETHSTTPIVIR